MGIALTLIFGILGVLGLYLTWRWRVQSGDLRYSWDDVHHGVADLHQKIRDSNWKPEVLVTVTGSGAIVANLFMKIMNERLPFYAVMLEDPVKPWSYTPASHRKIPAGRWTINVPESLLLESKENKILIIDSSHFSGLTMKALKSLLTENGFKDIRHACFVQIERPQGPTEEPDYCARQSNKAVFYYPWGKG